MTRSAIIALAILACALSASCGRVPLDQSAAASKVVAVTWKSAYAQNCAACHGADGTLAAARPMRDANYLASISREQLLAVSTKGVGVFMPALAASQGGYVPDAQIALIVDGMIAEWGKGGVPSSVPYSGALGSAASGATVYASFCQTCHGIPNGVSAGTGGTVTDTNYLRLVSDQMLRSQLIFGRADLGAACIGPSQPWQSAQRKLSSSEVADVVAFLASKRPQMRGDNP